MFIARNAKKVALQRRAMFVCFDSMIYRYIALLWRAKSFDQ